MRRTALCSLVQAVLCELAPPPPFGLSEAPAGVEPDVLVSDTDFAAELSILEALGNRFSGEDPASLEDEDLDLSSPGDELGEANGCLACDGLGVEDAAEQRRADGLTAGLNRCYREEMEACDGF